MIRVAQSIVGDGRDGRPAGDCLRACLASIFELPLDTVPDPTEGATMWRWLARFGLAPLMDVWAPSPEPIPPGYRWPASWWIATVNSEVYPGTAHAVVMRGFYTRDGSDAMHRVAWDPSPHPRAAPYLFSGAQWFDAEQRAELDAIVAPPEKRGRA